MLISPLNAFPWVVNGLMEAWISLDRLENFLDLPDFDMDKYYDAHITPAQNGLQYSSSFIRAYELKLRLCLLSDWPTAKLRLLVPSTHRLLCHKGDGILLNAFS